MADEAIDALLLSARFDDEGLAASGQQVVAEARRTAAAAAAAFRAAGVSEANMAATLARSGFAQAQAQAGPEPRIIRDKVADLKLLAGQLQQTTFFTEQFTGATSAMNLALISRPGGSREADNQRAKAFMITALAGDQMTESLTKSNRAANLARGGLVTLASQAIGTSSAIGQLAQSALFFAGGATGVIAVAGAVLVAAKAYEVLTAGARQAKEAQDALVAAFKARVDAAGDSPASQRGGARARLQELEVQGRQIQYEQAFARQVRDVVGILITRYQLEKNITEQKDLQRRIALDEVRAERAAIEARQAPSRDLISGLGTQLATLKLGEDAVRRMTVSAQARTGSERTAALAILDQIIAIEHAQKAAAGLEAEWGRINAQVRENEAAIRETEKAARDVAKAFGDDLFKALQKVRDAEDDFARSAREAIDSLQTGEEIHREFIDDAREAFRAVTDSTAGVVQAAAGVGLIGRAAAQSMLDVLSLADAMHEISLTGASLTNVFGAIGAGIGLLGGLGQAVFGKDATQLEHERIQEANTQAIERNTAAIEAASTAGGLARTQGSLRAALGSDIGQLARFFAESPLTFGDRGARAFDVALQEAGSSLADLQAIAEANGIQILDSKGRLVAGALDNLATALERANIEATSLGDTFADQARAADLRSRLAGEAQDAAAQFARELATLSRFSPAVQEAFAGIDLADKDAVRDAALGLFDQFEEGFFTAHPELFGDISKEDFLDFLGQGADYLDAFNDAVLDAARGLRDEFLPAGFARGRLLFQTSDFVPGGAVRSIDAPFVNTRGSDGAALPLPGGSSRSTVINIQPGAIVVDGSQDPEATAQAVIAHLRRLAMAQSGDTLQFGFN